MLSHLLTVSMPSCKTSRRFSGRRWSQFPVGDHSRRHGLPAGRGRPRSRNDGLQAGFVAEDDLVTLGPGEPAVGRDACGQLRRIVVAAAARGEPRVDQHDPPVAQLDERPLAIACVARPRLQPERPPHAGLLGHGPPSSVMARTNSSDRSRALVAQGQGEACDKVGEKHAP